MLLLLLPLVLLLCERINDGQLALAFNYIHQQFSSSAASNSNNKAEIMEVYGPLVNL